jgi:ABC-2 type transport system permease protein
VNDFGLTFLAPVCALVFATAAFGDIREDGSLVYLWLRPVRRWQVAVAAHLAALSIVVPLVVVPIVIGAAVISPEADVVAASAGAASVAVLAYSAVFLALGLRAARALIWGLVYVLLWEGFISQVGGAPAKLSIANYTRSILTHASGTALDQASASVVAAYAVPLVVAALALVYTARRFQRQDVA